MMCQRHNRFYRIGKCDLCIKDEEEIRKLEFEISLLESENNRINLQLYPIQD